jgi:hypothetical protein
MGTAATSFWNPAAASRARWLIPFHASVRSLPGFSATPMIGAAGGCLSLHGHFASPRTRPAARYDARYRGSGVHFAARATSALSDRPARSLSSLRRIRSSSGLLTSLAVTATLKRLQNDVMERHIYPEFVQYHACAHRDVANARQAPNFRQRQHRPTVSGVSTGRRRTFGHVP